MPSPDETERRLDEHDIRFENGRHEFAAQKELIANAIQRISKLEPGRADVLKWLGFGFAVMVTVLGSWWQLSERFSERPTIAQVRELVEASSRFPHPAVQSIQTQLIEVKADLRVAQDELKEIKAAVKDLQRRR